MKLFKALVLVVVGVSFAGCAPKEISPEEKQAIKNLTKLQTSYKEDKFEDFGEVTLEMSTMCAADEGTKEQKVCDHFFAKSCAFEPFALQEECGGELDAYDWGYRIGEWLLVEGAAVEAIKMALEFYGPKKMMSTIKDLIKALIKANPKAK